MAGPDRHEQIGTDPGVGPGAVAAKMDEPLPGPADPGGAHQKGYSADPRPGGAAPDADPVPLADAPDDAARVREQSRDRDVRPTGRGGPGDYTPNDRMMGSDR